MDLNKLGLVILNYNSHQMTARCVNSILHYYNIAIQMVIVDNHSSDGSYEILTEAFEQYKNIKVIFADHNSGYSYGNNLGIRYLIKNHDQVDYLAVLNPDVMIFDGKILQNLIYALMTDKSLAGISPLMIENGYLKPEHWAIRLPSHINNFLSSLVILRKINPLLYKSYGINPETLVAYVDVLPGSFFIMKKEIFLNIELFDENVFLYGEEILIAKKIKNKNFKLGLSCRDFFFHAHVISKKSLREELKHLCYSIKSHVYFNSAYNNKFWGLIDTGLLILFLPLRVFEVIVIHFYSKKRLSGKLKLMECE